VRKLKNLCERMTVVHTGKIVDAALLSRLMEYSKSMPPLSIGPRVMEDIERAMAQAGRKMNRAAEILGIHRATLWRRRKPFSRKMTP
jgi:DNA-binding NtrC family response regulator